MKKSVISIGMILCSMFLNNAVFAEQETVGPPDEITYLGPAPDWIIDKSADYIRSFVDKEYLDLYFILKSNYTVKSSTRGLYYLLEYYYSKIPTDYLGSDPTIGERANLVQVRLDENGTVFDYRGPTKQHTFSITREQVTTIAKNADLKEPISAYIYRVPGITEDGYVWVAASGSVTCKYSPELKTEECFILGVYVDVDDGSLIGNFSYSTLIRGGSVLEGGKEGYLKGKVTIWPIYPVETENVTNEIPPEIYEERKIVIYTQDRNSTVATVDIDKYGNYSVALDPGMYIVDINYVGVDSSKDVPKEIEIKPGETVKFDILIDTGIREGTQPPGGDGTQPQTKRIPIELIIGIGVLIIVVSFVVWKLLIK